MKKLAILLLCSPLASYAQTLPQAVQAALSFHPQIKAAEQQLVAQQANVNIQQAALKPHLILSGEVGRSALQTTAPFPESGSRWPNSLNLVLNKPIYTGGALNTAVDIAKLSVLANEQQNQQLRVGIAVQTIAAYVAVIRDQSLLALYQQSLASLKQAQNDTSKRFKAGEVTKTDVALAEARLAEGQAKLSQAQANLAISQSHFTQLTGQAADNLSSHLPHLSLPKDLATATALAQQAPVLQAQQRSVLISQKNIDLVKAQDKPQVSIEARAATQDNTDFGYDRMNSWGVFVKAQLPLYEGGQTQAKVSAAYAQYEATQQNFNDSSAIINQDITVAWQHWQAASAQIPAYQAQVQAAEIALDSTRKELNVGTRTTLDLLNTERELLAAKINLLLSEQEQSLASYQVLAVIGDLSVLDRAE